MILQQRRENSLTTRGTLLTTRGLPSTGGAVEFL